MTLTPIVSLDFSTNYTVTIGSTSSDISGNGMVSDYTFSFTTLIIIPLHEGWNLISVPLAQFDVSIDAVLQSIAGKWDYIQTYNATESRWKSNVTFRPYFLNDLHDLNHKMGFWINITEAGVNLTVIGYVPADGITLFAGWNLVGYPSCTQRNISDALAGTGYDRPVEGYNGTAPYRISQLSDTYPMKPGEGYWVHVPVDTIWTIEW